MRFLLNSLYLVALCVISPVVLYRMIRYGRYKKGFADRLGRIKRNNPEKKCVWIHAVSVGEVNAAKTVVSELEKRLSDYEIVISTTTDTGYARATAIYGDRHKVIYFPFDLSWIMERAFANIKPAICLLMELEVWPNFVEIANRRKIPVAVVNGRISDKSFGRYKKVTAITKRIFGGIDLILCQTDEYAGRFIEIGAKAEKVVVTGSLKYDTAQICDKVAGADEIASLLGIGEQTLIVAGGTGDDEEGIILDAYRNIISNLQCRKCRLVIVPRKPERFNEVAGVIKQRGFGLLRYSEAAKAANTTATDSQTVILGDTMGQLRKFYSLATLIFVGRSLVPMGGSDMMEAAALGKCTMFGPHAFNFRQTVKELLDGGGAILVENSQQLEETLKKCLLEPEYARKIAANGQLVIKNNQGATAKTIEQIEKLLRACEK